VKKSVNNQSNTIDHENNTARSSSIRKNRPFMTIKETKALRNRAQSNEKERQMMTLLPTLGSRKNITGQV
jgi:hypothetical protein